MVYRLGNQLKNRSERGGFFYFSWVSRDGAMDAQRREEFLAKAQRSAKAQRLFHATAQRMRNGATRFWFTRTRKGPPRRKEFTLRIFIMRLKGYFLFFAYLREPNLVAPLRIRCTVA
jgi:hypothetical protein